MSTVKRMFRIEGPNGIGPYQSGTIRGCWKEDGYYHGITLDGDLHEQPIDMDQLPAPHKDFEYQEDSPWRSKDFVYGVESRDALRQWFDDETLFRLALLGYRVVEYTTDYMEHGTSGNQVRAPRECLTFVSSDTIA